MGSSVCDASSGLLKSSSPIGEDILHHWTVAFHLVITIYHIPVLFLLTTFAFTFSIYLFNNLPPDSYYIYIWTFVNLAFNQNMQHCNLFSSVWETAYESVAHVQQHSSVVLFYLWKIFHWGRVIPSTTFSTVCNCVNFIWSLVSSSPVAHHQRKIQNDLQIFAPSSSDSIGAFF